MKQNLKWMFGVLALAGVCTFSACSDDDDEEPIKVFPELPDSVSDATVGQEGVIKFDAYADWTISADQVWVKFKKTGSTDEPTVSLSGKAGLQSVSYVIGDENLDFESKTATITLAMDNKRDTMIVSRVAKERSFEFFSIQETDEGFVYTPAEKLEMAYSDVAEGFHAKYAVRANYKWVLSVPEWVEIIPSSMSGEPNVEIENNEELKLYFIDINKEKATKEDMEGQLEFRDYNGEENGPVINAIPVSCKGTATWTRVLSTLPATITFNGDGKFENPDMGMEMDAVNISTMTATGSDYKFIILAKDGEWYGVMNDITYQLELDATNLGWFGVDASEFKPAEEYPAFAIRHYDLWASPAKAPRHATLMAVPEAVADSVGDDFNGYLNGDGNEILPQFQQYVIAQLEQGANASTELEFAMGSMLPDGVDGITIEPMPEEELGQYAGDFGVQAGYVVTYNSFDMYTMSALKLGNLESGCAPAYTSPDTALYDPENKQGWLILSADSGFQGFMFDFTNEFVPFNGPREATIILMDPDTYQSHVVIRVVQNADNGNTGNF